MTHRQRSFMHSYLKSACLLSLAAIPAFVGSQPVAADWPGFLGPGGNAVSEMELPTSFSIASEGQPAVHIAWRTELPGRSVSGPIVVGNKVITTSSSSMEGRWMNVSAVDADTGQILWQRSTKATGRPFCHPISANAAPTPCSDGQRIYAFFSSNDLVCYDLDGNLQWFRSLTDKHPLAGNDVGMSASPVVVDGIVVVSVECQADSFTAGIDSVSGETRWEIPRARKANWASPCVVQGQDGQRVVALQSSSELLGVAPQTGEIAWRLEIPCASIATAVFENGKLFVPSGGVKAFAIPKALEQPELLWDSSKINPNSASFLVSRFGLLGLNRSVLACCDEQGELSWQARLPDAGQFWATPVVAGDYLYAFALSGKCFIVRLGKTEGTVIAECELGEEVLGSPALAKDALFVRSTGSLWKIAE